MNNNLNDNEFIFSIPMNNNINIFNTIELMLEDIQNNINISNIIGDDQFVEMNIEFQYLNHPNNENEHKKYFKNCLEINSKLDKPIKIKKEDTIIHESCFICMENYKVSQFKRELPNCKHCFHKKCVDKWLKKNASCPVCRDELIKD